MPQEMTFGEALVSALGDVMDQDSRGVLIGGGLVSSGPGQARFARLREKYSSRIKSPPIAELGFCGIAAGAAMAGLRPLVDIGTATFSYEANLFHALRDSRWRRRPTFREPAAVVLEHAGLAGSDAVQSRRRQRTAAHGSPQKPEPDDFLCPRETYGRARPGSRRQL